MAKKKRQTKIDGKSPSRSDGPDEARTTPDQLVAAEDTPSVGGAIEHQAYNCTEEGKTPDGSSAAEDIPPTGGATEQSANSNTEEPKPTQRRYDIINELFTSGQCERKGARQFDIDSKSVRAMLGAPVRGDPYEVLDQDRLNNLTAEELQRIYLDHVHGPTTICAKREAGGKLTLDYNKRVQFPIAFGNNWRAKWRIAKYLFEVKKPELPKDGLLMIGPGGTAFHVALQIAWRLRQRIENEIVDEDFFREIHTDSFEVARLIAPLAVDPAHPLSVYLSGNRVSRQDNLARESLSILTNSPEKPPEDPWIDALVIGCQRIDKAGSLYTWHLANHRETIKGYLKGLAGDLIVVCTSDKIGEHGRDSQLIRIDHPKEKCYLVTDEQPQVSPANFQVLHP